MDLTKFFKSVLDQDHAPIVLCDLEHTIIYMNPTAEKRYAAMGGAGLLGQNLMKCHNPASTELIEKCLDWFRESPDHNVVYESRNDTENKDVYVVALRGDAGELIGYYEKHEYRSNETGKFYDFDA